MVRLIDGIDADRDAPDERGEGEGDDGGDGECSQDGRDRRTGQD